MTCWPARQSGVATVVIQAIENGSPDEMRQLIDVMRRKRETGLAVLLAAAAEGKVQLVAGLSKDLIDRGLHAGNWLRRSHPLSAAAEGAGRTWRRRAANRRRKSPPRSKRRTRRFARGSSSDGNCLEAGPGAE